MATNLPPEISFLIDFNVHWVPAALGLDIPAAAAATMLGISEADFVAYTAGVEAEVKQTAQTLLAQPGLAQAIDKFPVHPGGKVMFIGDSITTYRYGYARLFEAMVNLQRPGDNLQFVNVAQSGYTSTQGLENCYTQFLAHQPDWVFIKYGVNDCKEFGEPPAKTLVSLAEYRENMAGIIQAFRRHTSAQIFLLTPTPVVEEITNNNPDFRPMRMIWRNEVIQTFAGAVLSLAEQYRLPVVDLMSLFGPAPDPALFLPDGLHPSPAGHQLILEQALRTL